MRPRVRMCVCEEGPGVGSGSVLDESSWLGLIGLVCAQEAGWCKELHVRMVIPAERAWRMSAGMTCTGLPVPACSALPDLSCCLRCPANQCPAAFCCSARASPLFWRTAPLCGLTQLPHSARQPRTAPFVGAPPHHGLARLPSFTLPLCPQSTRYLTPIGQKSMRLGARARGSDVGTVYGPQGGKVRLHMLI